MQLTASGSRALVLGNNGGTSSIAAMLATGPQGLPGPGSAAWAASEAVGTGDVRQAPDGSWIKSTAGRTTGATFDATEQTFWAPVSATVGTLEQVALADTYAARGIASTQPLLRTMAEDLVDQTALFIGDSTMASASTSPIPTALADLFAQFPAWTIRTAYWNDTNQTHDAATTLHTGSGARILTVYILAVNGTSTDYPLGCLDVGVAAINPDLIFVSHGHNEDSGTTPALTGPNIRAQMLALTESLTAVVPQASLVLIGQNPKVGSTIQSTRAREYARIAAERGYGFVDLIPVYYADAGWSETLGSNTLMADANHPNAAGSALGGAYIAAVAWTRNTDYPVKAQPPSTLTQAADPLVGINGDFASWSGSAPDGWALSGATASKDYDTFDPTGPGYGLNLTASGATPSYAYRRIVGAELDQYRGRWVTVTAKIHVPAALASTTAGAVGLADDVSTANDPTVPLSGNLLTNRTATLRHGKVITIVNMRKVSDKAPFLEVRLYADTGNQATAVATFLSVDLTPGAVPRREARRVTVLAARSMSTPADLPSLVFSSEPEDYGLADAATITQLTDASGLGNHATVVAGQEATLADTVDIINGKSVAVFPGGKLYTIPVAMPDAVTEWIVYNNYSHNGGTGSLFGNAGGVTAAQFTRNTAVSPQGSAGPALTATARALNAAGDHILCLRYDWTKGYFYAWLDGLLIGTSRSGVNGLPATFAKPAGNITVGSWRGGTGASDTGIFKTAGIYVCNKALSEAERRGAFAMLATRFGITLAG